LNQQKLYLCLPFCVNIILKLWQCKGSNYQKVMQVLSEEKKLFEVVCKVLLLLCKRFEGHLTFTLLNFFRIISGGQILEKVSFKEKTCMERIIIIIEK